jgi:hypothetical protein
MLTDYATPHGHLELRKFIARKKELYDYCENNGIDVQEEF